MAYLNLVVAAGLYPWRVAATLTAPAAAYRALTEDVALVDRSERGKLALAGPEAKAFLNGQVSNDVEALGAGTGLYATFLTPKGKMLGDLRVLDLGDELWLDTERAALQALFDLIRRGTVGWRAELHKRTVQQALLSLGGPRAGAAAGAEDLGPEHASRRATLGGAPVVLVATDLGVDVICEADDAVRVRAALDVPEAPQAVAEIVRVESGRPRFGVELDGSVIPQEAGLNERAVSFTKGCYVGQETVARLHWRGKPNRHLRGLRLSAPAAPGDVLRAGEREVGHVGSAVVSPRLGPIALALVRREVQPGDTIAVGPARAAATVVELPFTPR